MDLGPKISAARERVGFSQDEVATLIGQPRTVISNWEQGIRRPNSQQLTKLAAIYRRSLDDLFNESQQTEPEFEKLVYRDAGERLNTDGKYEIQKFLNFLNKFGEFLKLLGEDRGLMDPPMSLRSGRPTKDDIRRKAEDARRFFRLGDGPVGDLTAIADLHGITVLSAPLGSDLRETISGASLIHPSVGFSVLLNGQTTLGRRQFTLAHEIGHAMFHHHSVSVGYLGRRDVDERFADAFAAEFLVPTSSLQATAEGMGLSKVDNPESVVELQRYFNVSYEMMLVRLRMAGLISDDSYAKFRSVRPVHLAKRIGYSIDLEEWIQDVERWGFSRFPRRLVRLLRRAFDEGIVTISGAAALTDLAEEDIEELLVDEEVDPNFEEEYEHLRTS